MSNILEKKKITKIEVVSVGKKCDVCGNEERDNKKLRGWHTIHAHHNEWGNDSIDSVSEHDVCSMPCYWTVIHKLYDEWKTYPSTEIDGMNIQFVEKLIKL